MAAAEAAGGAVPQRPPGFRNLKNEEFFMEIKKAQEVLMSDVRRSNYDRFGDHNYGTILFRIHCMTSSDTGVSSSDVR